VQKISDEEANKNEEHGGAVSDRLLLAVD